MTKIKRFYVGSRSPHVQDGWAKSTLQEAIKHAKFLCEETGEDQFVVQIIRRVGQRSQPIVVEKINGR